MRICDNVAEILLSKLNCSVITFVIMVSNNNSAWIDPTRVLLQYVSYPEGKKNPRNQQPPPPPQLLLQGGHLKIADCEYGNEYFTYILKQV